MRFPKFFWALLGGVLLVSSCQNSIFQPPQAAVSALRDVAAVRLNFRYEGDVPAPTLDAAKISADERNAGVQSDFDSNRPEELLDRTLTSPDKKRVVAIYHRLTDVQAEFRLDMYTAEGKLLKKLTSDAMAVHFPDTIVWSPDSGTLAFVAMLRAAQPNIPAASPAASPGPANTATNTQTPVPGSTNSADVSNVDVPTSTPTPASAPTPAAPTGILTFRSEQIYICGAEGGGVKPITENEGLIYFYYAWSPDSTMLAALATTSREWKYMDILAGSKGETMIPQGRPRIIEKNGRERRLDDNMTAVRPVWSPDSAKVAAAFGNQIRLYDANGTAPTQAAIPLRNQLLISSQAYDREQQRQSQGANADPISNPPADSLSTLPDEKLLVSFNPIVELAWTADDLLYLKTAYIRRMRNEADSVMSFARWHRIILTTQAVAPAR
ncbi:MAG: hypothetical protein ACKVQJ_01050 [Pyrinomonadaceae bacterium]